MSEKISRKELLRQEDAFLKTAAESVGWVETHKRQVTVAGVAVFAVAIVGWGVFEVRGSRDASASEQLRLALELREAQIVTGDTKADPKATPPTFGSEDERRTAVRAALAGAAEAGGSGVGELARFYLAELDVDAGRIAEATTQYQGILNDLSPTDSLFFLAVERLAYAQEQQGQLDGAMATWQRLTEGAAKPFYGDRALLQLARLLEAKKDVAQAKEALQRIEKEYPTSKIRSDATAMLTRLGGSEGVAPVAKDAVAAP